MLIMYKLLKTAVRCIKHQRDLHALSALYLIYCTGGSFEVLLQWEVSG